MGSPAFWDFDFLIENNSVQPQGKKNLLITNKKFGRNIKRLSEGFVSWLLYAYSPNGSRVNDPVALAVKRLCTEMHEGAGGDLNRLAQMPPHALKSLFDADLAGKEFLGDSIEANIYSINFQGLLKIHKQELYRRLFGS